MLLMLETQMGPLRKKSFRFFSKVSLILNYSVLKIITENLTVWSNHNKCLSGVPYEELVQAFQFLDPNTRLIPKNKLSPETASYWRNLASYLYDESEVKGVSAAAVHLENILPELTPFCNYIRELLLENDQQQQADSEDPNKEEAEQWQRLFNGQQLIHMISLFDLGDVVC